MAVVMSHNSPDTTERIRRGLVGNDSLDVRIIDSGSEDECKARKTEETTYCDNLYWTGCWSYAIELFEDSDCDVLWVLGGDVELRSTAQEYVEAISSAMPFGCWHPGVDGISRPLMQHANTDGKPWEVWHLEGITLAVSREALSEMGEMPKDNKYGWGVDIWINHKSWSSGMKNVLDGRVKVFHPDLRGYSSYDAHSEMLSWFTKLFGPKFRDKLHFWADGFSYNVIGEYNCSNRSSDTGNILTKNEEDNGDYRNADNSQDSRDGRSPGTNE